MAVDASYRDYVIDLLQAAGLSVWARPMFGGAGLFHGDKIVGVIVGNELYLRLRIPPGTRGRLRRFGRNYTMVPVDVMEDRDRLAAWVEKTLSREE
jgi:hypothetical protein